MKSNRQPHSAILPDGSVNVSLLQLEIGQELADETRYAAEDSMKKRAIHMSESLYLFILPTRIMKDLQGKRK